MRIADLQRDEAILQRARDDSRQRLTRDPHLAAPEYTTLRTRIHRRYGQAMELGDVG